MLIFRRVLTFELLSERKRLLNNYQQNCPDSYCRYHNIGSPSLRCCVRLSVPMLGPPGLHMGLETTAALRASDAASMQGKFLSLLRALARFPRDTILSTVGAMGIYAGKIFIPAQSFSEVSPSSHPPPASPPNQPGLRPLIHRRYESFRTSRVLRVSLPQHRLSEPPVLCASVYPHARPSGPSHGVGNDHGPPGLRCNHPQHCAEGGSPKSARRWFCERASARAPFRPGKIFCSWWPSLASAQWVCEVGLAAPGSINRPRPAMEACSGSMPRSGASCFYAYKNLHC